MVLGFLALGLAIHFYNQGKRSEKEVALLLEGMRSQTDLLNEITLRQLDKFTDYFTKLRPQHEENMFRAFAALKNIPAEISKHVTTLAEKKVGERSEIDELTFDSLVLGFHYACQTNFVMRVLRLLGTQSQFLKPMAPEVKQRIEAEINKSYQLITDLRHLLEDAKKTGGFRKPEMVNLFDITVREIIPATGRADEPLKRN